MDVQADYCLPVATAIALACNYVCTWVHICRTRCIRHMQLWHATLQDLLLCAGAQLFCFKKLSLKTGNGVKVEVEVELDGVACSDTSCNIVERKHQFTHKEVLELICKVSALK